MLRSQGSRNQRPKDLFFTNDQLMKILRDRAIFTESPSLRFRSVIELGKFGSQAIPIIRDVIESVIGSDKVSFKIFCHNIIADIQNDLGST